MKARATLIGLAGAAFASSACAAQPPAASRPGHGALPGDPAADRRLARLVGDDARVQAFAHFVFISDTNQACIDRLGETSERTYDAVAAFAERLEIRTRRPDRKMPVILFDRWEAYRDHAARGGFVVHETSPGYFDQRAGHCVLFNYANGALLRGKRDEAAAARRALAAAGEPTDAAGRTRRAERLRAIEAMEASIRQFEQIVNATVVRHEIAHQVLVGLGVHPNHDRVPRWLMEGLAMQFEDPGGANEHRLTDYLADRRQARPLSMRALIEDPALIGPGAADAARAYATAWALVKHLSATEPARFRTYLAGIDDRVGEAAGGELRRFEAEFGRVDEGFEARVEGWIRDAAER